MLTIDSELESLPLTELVEAARQGDTAAFSELYARFAPRIYGYLYHHLDGRRQEAEDLTADVFAKVLEKIGSYEARGVPFSAWLFRIAHNQLVDHLRRRPRMPMVPLEDAFEVREAASFQALDQNVSAEQIKSGIGHLTEEQREVVLLRFVKGYNTAETARSLGKTEDAVKKLQARGLAALRRALECPSGCWKVVLDSTS